MTRALRNLQGSGCLVDLHFDPSVWIAAYGYWAVFVLIGLESMGVPLTGETVLVAVRFTLAAALPGRH